MGIVKLCWFFGYDTPVWQGSMRFVLWSFGVVQEFGCFLDTVIPGNPFKFFDVQKHMAFFFVRPFNTVVFAEEAV